MKPKLFVASSVEGLSVAYAVQQNLRHNAEVTVWDQGVFAISATAVDSLLALLATVDFGVFVFSPDDILKIRGISHSVVRDNVLFELGLFIGQLGRERSFIFVPEGAELHLPTDLIGLVPGTYETSRADSNMAAGCGPACHQVRESVSRLSFLRKPSEAPKSAPTPINEKDASLAEQANVEPSASKEHWIDAIAARNYDRAIELLKMEEEKASEADQKYRFSCFVGWAMFEKDATASDLHFEKLIELHPEEPSVYVWWAGCYNSAEVHDRALTIVERGMSKFPDDENLLKLRQKVVRKKGDSAGSLQLLQAAVTKHPHSEKLAEELAGRLVEEKKSAEARNILVRAISSNPKSESLWGKLAQIAYDEGDNIAAVVAFRKLTVWAEKNSGYPAMLGNAYLNLELFNLALESYKEGNRRGEGKEAWIIGNIANIFSQCCFFGEAIERFEAALKLDPTSEFAHERLATAMKNRNEEQEKLQALIASAPPILSPVPIPAAAMSPLHPALE